MTTAERNRVIAERDGELSELHKREKFDKGLSGLSKTSVKLPRSDGPDVPSDLDKLVADHKRK
jgi:hypothetical protein